MCLLGRSQQDTIIKTKDKVWYSFSGNIVTKINTDLVRLDQCNAREKDYIDLLYYQDSMQNIQNREIRILEIQKNLLDTALMKYQISDSLLYKDTQILTKKVKLFKTVSIVGGIAFLIALIF